MLESEALFPSAQHANRSCTGFKCHLVWRGDEGSRLDGRPKEEPMRRSRTNLRRLATLVLGSCFGKVVAQGDLIVAAQAQKENT